MVTPGNISDSLCWIACRPSPHQRLFGGRGDAGDVGAVVGNFDRDFVSDRSVQVDRTIAKEQRRHERGAASQHPASTSSLRRPKPRQTSEPQHRRAATGRTCSSPTPAPGAATRRRKDRALAGRLPRVKMQGSKRHRHPVRREQLQMIQMRESIRSERKRDRGDERGVVTRRERQAEKVRAKPAQHETEQEEHVVRQKRRLGERKEQVPRSAPGSGGSPKSPGRRSTGRMQARSTTCRQRDRPGRPPQNPRDQQRIATIVRDGARHVQRQGPRIRAGQTDQRGHGKNCGLDVVCHRRGRHLRWSG